MLKFLYLTIILLNLGFSENLTNSTEINITKYWSQEPSGWTYPININVPETTIPDSGFSVCILLHGNGGNGNGILNTWSSSLSNHVLIAPSGYMSSWNIANEDSDALDVEMIDDLINELQTYNNVNQNKIRILGYSNGATLSNRIFIENRNQGVDIICSIASQLNDVMYRNGHFYKPFGETGGANNENAGYNMVTAPIMGRKYLNIHNVNDGVIPYYGGWHSWLGVGFHNCLYAIYLIANSQGYNGGQLNEEEGIEIEASFVFEYSYLSGQVVHLKGIAGHNINDTQRQYIINYIYFGNGSLSIDENVMPLPYQLHHNYPNPFNPITTLRYDLPEDALVNLTIYDVIGQVVKTMVNNQQNAGFKSVQWNTTNDNGAPVSAGLYLYKIQAGEFRQTKKMVLLK